MHPQTDSRQLSELRVHEARLLALMLRTSRLTWLFAAEGTDKTALLRNGVMPLLQRRAGERFDRQVLAGSESRPANGAGRGSTTAAGQTRRTELAIYFDQWDETPLVALKSLIVQSLPDVPRQSIDVNARLSAMVDQIHGGLGLNLVFVLNDFERYFGGEASHIGRSQFADEWIEAVLHPRMPASFLVALDESSRSRIDRFKSRIPGLDHNALRLLPQAPHVQGTPALPVPPQQHLARGGAKSGLAAPRPSTDTRAHVKYSSKRSPTRTPIKVEEVYAFIEETLAKTLAQRRMPTWDDDHAAAEPTAATLVLDLKADPHSASKRAVAPGAGRIEPGLYEPASLGTEPPIGGPLRAVGKRLAVALRRLGGHGKR